MKQRSPSPLVVERCLVVVRVRDPTLLPSCGVCYGVGGGNVCAVVGCGAMLLVGQYCVYGGVNLQWWW